MVSSAEQWCTKYNRDVKHRSIPVPFSDGATNYKQYDILSFSCLPSEPSQQCPRSQNISTQCRLHSFDWALSAALPETTISPQNLIMSRRLAWDSMSFSSSTNWLKIHQSIWSLHPPTNIHTHIHTHFPHVFEDEVSWLHSEHNLSVYTLDPFLKDTTPSSLPKFSALLMTSFHIPFLLLEIYCNTFSL